MTNDAEVAKLAQEAAEEITRDYSVGRFEPEIAKIITRHFSPALTALQHELEIAKLHIADCHDSTATLREKLDAAECACSDEEAAHKGTLRLLNLIRKRLEALQEELAAAEDSLEQERLAFQHDIQKQMKENARLKAYQADWRKGVELIATAVGVKSLSCVTVAEKCLEVLAKLEAADLRINQLETECGHKEATIGELEQKIATVQAELKEQRNSANAWNSLMDCFEAMSEYQEWNKDIDQAELTKTDSFIKAWTKQRDRAIAAEAKLATAEAERDEAKEQCAVEAENCIASEAALATAEAERDRLRERVEAVASELESLGKRSTDYDYAARQLRAALTPPASGKAGES